MMNVTETETMAAYMKPPSRGGGGDDDGRVSAKGFVVRDAPWNAAGNKVGLFDSTQVLKEKKAFRCKMQ